MDQSCRGQSKVLAKDRSPDRVLVYAVMTKPSIAAHHP